MFVINDLNISYPHAEVERVPVSKRPPSPGFPANRFPVLTSQP